eukprot:3480373-Pyramimonas_sp.AAC.1
MGDVAPLAKITDCCEEGKVTLMRAFSSRLNMAPALDSLIQAEADYPPGLAPMGLLERMTHPGHR